MEALIAIAVMIAVLEIRELQWNKRFRELEESFITARNVQISVVSDLEQKIKESNSLTTELGNDIRSLKSSLDELRTSQSYLVKEYELKVRSGGIEDGQAIDGVIGL